VKLKVLSANLRNKAADSINSLELWQGDKPQLFGVDPDAQPAVCGLKYIIIN
jgi:hypothetical protein